MYVRLSLLLSSALMACSVLAQSPVEPDAADQAQEAPPVQKLPGTTTLATLFELVRKIDPEAHIQGNAAQFRVQDRQLILVGDENAGRMRIMTPVAQVDALDGAILHRLLQANFDAVLDSRYAIADDLVWSVFIHPLPPMDEAQFANAVGQVYIAAATFGSTYTSGALVYGGGDSNAEHEKLLEELRKRTETRT